MKRRIVVSIASVALCLSGLVVAQAGAATKTVSASGGSVSFSASVRNAKTCGWSSSPTITGFAKTVKCKTGTVSRSARFRANTSTTAKSYAVTLTVRGKTTTVDHWKVTQAVETPPTTTTVAATATLPTTTTTTARALPTAVTVVASESPAIVGDTITYSMTVTDVLTTTTGAAYLTDNGVKLTGCSGPTATNQGTLAYSCPVTYTGAGSHLIVGVFLGDSTYEQSAGLLNEVVQATATTTTTTTTTQPPTTTTIPKPTITMSITAINEVCTPVGCGNGSTLSYVPVTGPVPVGSFIAFTATAISSDGTDPSQGGIGDQWTWGGLIYGTGGRVNWAFTTAGTYDIHVAIIAGNPSSPDYGIPASADYTLVVK
jgi:hypothetical protein